jgi:hypothetical protein
MPLNECFNRSANRAPVVVDDTFKSYATQENLQRALEKLGFADEFHVVCRTTGGRWTAIFPFSNFNGGYVARYSSLGFMTLG